MRQILNLQARRRNIRAGAAMTREFLLAHMRAARVRAQLAICEIDTTGVALKSGMIEADDALAWLADVDALRFLTEPGGADG